MKIAVYIVGQWRGSSYDCSKYLKKIFEEFDTDYYIYTWECWNGKLINLDISDKTRDIFDTQFQYHQSEDIEKIRNSYPHVVSMKIGSRELMTKIALTDSRLSSFPQFYSAFEANKYRKIYENGMGFRYDVIIKIRPDIIFSERGIQNMIENIKYISKNPKAVFSFYQTLQEDMKPDLNLVWDYYTVSSPFGMDCMMEWVDDVINTDSKHKLFSSNYFIKHGLLANPYYHPDYKCASPIIIRELFKYNNLVDKFYECISLKIHNKESNNLPVSYLRFINEYLYMWNENREKFDGWVDWSKTEESDILKIRENKYKPEITEYLSNDRLHRLANTILENYETEQKRYIDNYWSINKY